MGCRGRGTVVAGVHESDGLHSAIQVQTTTSG